MYSQSRKARQKSPKVHKKTSCRLIGRDDFRCPTKLICRAARPCPNLYKMTRPLLKYRGIFTLRKEWRLELWVVYIHCIENIGRSMMETNSFPRGVPASSRLVSGTYITHDWISGSSLFGLLALNAQLQCYNFCLVMLGSQNNLYLNS